MKKSVLSILTIFALSMNLWLFMSCTKNPTAPGGESLFWFQVSAGDTVPAVLNVGDTASFVLLLADSNGFPFSAVVQGLPTHLYSMDSSADTLLVHFELAGDQLVVDSIYNVLISAWGPSTGDTLRYTFSFVVRDPVPADTNSLWALTEGGISIPDTIYHGDSILHQITFGDSAGRPILAEVQGVPSTLYVLEHPNGTSMDTLIARFNLIGEVFTPDSLYELTIRVTGSGLGDTLTIKESFLVLDTASKFTLWSKVLSADTIPDTLFYGDTIQYLIQFGSKTGDVIEVENSPLPSNNYSKDVLGDTALFRIKLVPDNLSKDSLYTFQVTVLNTVVPDTLKMDYAFYVRDTVDRPTLWSKIEEGGVFPDTLFKGDSLHYVIRFGDSSALPIDVQVGGLPSSLYQVDTLGDTLRLVLNVVGDSLVEDSLYMLDVFVSGSGSGDSLRFTHSLLVLDTVGTLWYQSIPDSLPKFVYYGDSLTLDIKAVQIGSAVVDAIVSDFPGVYQIDTSGDTVNVRLREMVDSLASDSLYRFSVHLNGVEDSVSLNYSFYVIDTTTPDEFSLWMNRVPTLWPDTLLYGDTLRASILFGDTSGRPVSVSVLGLPASMGGVLDTVGDTTTLSFHLVGEALDFDSGYTIQVRLQGSGASDTLSYEHSLFVLDTNRLGGLKKYVKGMYWHEVQYDAWVSHKDSANVSTTIKDTYEHRKFTQVLDVKQSGEALIYSIAKFDTLIGQDSVSAKFELIKHTASGAELLIPQDAQFLDTLTVQFFTLPIEVGQSWPTADVTVDTALAFDNIPVRIVGGYSGESRITGFRNRTSTNGKDYSCFLINASIDNEISLLLDTVLVNGTDTLPKGDSIAVSRQNTISDNCISSDLTVSISGYELETKFEENFYEGTVVRDTLTKESLLTRYFDPRVGSEIKFE